MADQLREDERASGTTLEPQDESSEDATAPAEVEKTRTQDASTAQDPNAIPEGNTITKTATSQSQVLTKSKKIIIMGALCVSP